MQRSSRMRSGRVKGSPVAVAAALLYLGSIKREVHAHSERLQRAHHNDSIRGRAMLTRMDKMEADINRLRDSVPPRLLFICLHLLCHCLLTFFVSVNSSFGFV